MLSSLFGFKGRIGRLRYFVTCLVLGPALIAAFVALMLVTGFHPGAGKTANLMSIALAALVVVPAWLWTALSLQTCRIRDIGWNPLFVILGWFGLGVLDRLAAMADPALALGPLHQNTLFGVVINLAFAGVLLFWPGDNGKGLEARWEEAFPAAPEPEPVAAAPRVAAPYRPASGAPSFGRRGL